MTHQQAPSYDPNEDNDGTNVFVVGLQTLTRQKDLEEICSKYGKVVTCEIKVDPHSEVSRGFAFVKMGTKDEANNLITALNGSKIDGALIRARLSRRGGSRPPTPGSFLGKHPPPFLRDPYRDPYQREPYYGRDYYSQRDPYYRPPPHLPPPPPVSHGHTPVDPRYEPRDPGYYRDPYYDRPPPPPRHDDPYRRDDPRAPYDYPRRDPSYVPPPSVSSNPPMIPSIPRPGSSYAPPEHSASHIAPGPIYDTQHTYGSW